MFIGGFLAGVCFSIAVKMSYEWHKYKAQFNQAAAPNSAFSPEFWRTNNDKIAAAARELMREARLCDDQRTAASS